MAMRPVQAPHIPCTKSHNRVGKITPRWDYRKVHCLELNHAPCACPGLILAMCCRCGGEKRGVGARWCTPDLGRAKVRRALE